MAGRVERQQEYPVTTEERDGFNMGFRAAACCMYDFLMNDGTPPPSIDEVRTFVDKLLNDNQSILANGFVQPEGTYVQIVGRAARRQGGGE